MLEPGSNTLLTLVEPGDEFTEHYAYQDATTDKGRTTLITYIYLGNTKTTTNLPKWRVAATHKIREVRRIDKDTGKRARGNTLGSGPMYVQRSWFRYIGFDVKEDE